jgi:YHS domain-containing protein
MKNLVISVVAIGLLSLAACGGSPSTPTVPTPDAVSAAPAGSSAAADDVKAPGTAKVGDKARCPISGEVFTVTDKSPKAEYEGKTYYFCCPGCEGKFKADPKRYLSGPKA